MSNESRLLKVLVAPHVSEKATAAIENGQYVFKIAVDATKKEVKKAVKLLFNVDVVSTQVSNVKGKTKTFARIKGQRAGYKKAYITLKEGQSIELGAAG